MAMPWRAATKPAAQKRAAPVPHRTPKAIAELIGEPVAGEPGVVRSYFPRSAIGDAFKPTYAKIVMSAPQDVLDRAARKLP
jgi:hypothetical protein